MATVLRKITIKDVAGKVDLEQLLKAENKTMNLAKIFGMAYKGKPEESALGFYVRFLGRFRAVNSEGEIFDAPALIVPAIAQDMLTAALEQDGVKEVQFAIEVSVVYDAESVTKYRYVIKPLIEAAADDPLERLTAQLNVKAIAAPAKDKAGK